MDEEGTINRTRADVARWRTVHYARFLVGAG